MEWQTQMEFEDGSIHDIVVYRLAYSEYEGTTRYFIEYYDYTLSEDGLDAFAEVYYDYETGEFFKYDTGLEYDILNDRVYGGFDPCLVNDFIAYKTARKKN